MENTINLIRGNMDKAFDEFINRINVKDEFDKEIIKSAYKYGYLDAILYLQKIGLNKK